LPAPHVECSPRYICMNIYDKHVNIHIHIYICVCVHVCIHAYIWIYIHMHTQTYVSTNNALPTHYVGGLPRYKCIYIHNIYTYQNMLIYVYTYFYIYIYIYIYMYRNWCADIKNLVCHRNITNLARYHDFDVSSKYHKLINKYELSKSLNIHPRLQTDTKPDRQTHR